MGPGPGNLIGNLPIPGIAINQIPQMMLNNP